MRRYFVWLHRWAGLAMAGFLILVALTGSLLAFWNELNHWMTPQLYPGPHGGIELGAGTLALRAEAIAPQARANTDFSGLPRHGMGRRRSAARRARARLRLYLS